MWAQCWAAGCSLVVYLNIKQPISPSLEATGSPMGLRNTEEEKLAIVQMQCSVLKTFTEPLLWLLSTASPSACFWSHPNLGSRKKTAPFPECIGARDAEVSMFTTIVLKTSPIAHRFDWIMKSVGSLQQTHLTIQFKAWMYFTPSLIHEGLHIDNIFKAIYRSSLLLDGDMTYRYIRYS